MATGTTLLDFGPSGVLALAPTAVLAASGWTATPPLVTDIDESPDSPDGVRWTQADVTGPAATARLGFPTPASPPTGPQRIRVLAKAGTGSTQTLTVTLYEASRPRVTLGSVVLPTAAFALLTFPFDAAWLTTRDGSDVEVEVTFGIDLVGGAPGLLEAVEWTALAAPQRTDASVVVTGQTGITAGSLVEAWLFPQATADHTADEHVVEPLAVVAHTVVAGTGFTVTGRTTNALAEPLVAPHPAPVWPTAGTSRGDPRPSAGGRGTGLAGTWTVAWAWT